MKHLHSATILCLALFFFSPAIPCNASIIEFTSTLTEGDVSTTGPGSAVAVTEMLGDFNTLTISGAPSGNGVYSGLFLAEAYSPDVLTITGSLPSLNSNLAANTTLLTITFSSSGLTANATTSAFSLNFPTDVVLITPSATLLSDLSLTGVTLSLTGLTDSGKSQSGAGNSFTSSDPSPTLSSPVPEPGPRTMLLFGLAATVFAARRIPARRCMTGSE